MRFAYWRPTVCALRALLLADYTDLLSIVVSTPLSQPISRDPDDDRVLACAIAAGADVIVSGDQDLLVLTEFQGIPILTATQTLERIGT